MTAFLALVRTDLRLFFSNRRAVIMAVLAPIVIAAFFGYLFGDHDSAGSKIDVAVVDLDRSDISRQIIAALNADASLAVTTADAASAADRLGAGKITAVLTLPDRYGRDATGTFFTGDEKPVIGLAYDPSQGTATQVVRGLLAEHAMQTVARAVFSGTAPVIADLRSRLAADVTMPADDKVALGAIYDNVERLQHGESAGAAASVAPPSTEASAPDNGLGFGLPYTLHETAATSAKTPGAKYNSYAHSFAGMGVQFVLLMGMDLGLGLLLMRRQDLWQRLRAAPISKATLLGSRVASGAAIATIVLAIVYMVAMAGFGVRIDGSVLGFVGVVLSLALFTASFGLMLAAIGKTPEATRGLAILAVLLLVMLGGAWVPAFVFPAWLQQVSLFVPTRWAVDGLDAMTWRGLPFAAALPPIGVLLGFSAVFAVVAVARFDWQE